MFIEYSNEHFKNLANLRSNAGSDRGKQHNILALIGNGFDIDLIHRYGLTYQEFHQTGKIFTSSYSDFFDYLTRFYSPSVDDNLLYTWMRTAKKNNLKNWSDFEGLIEINLNSEFSDLSSLRKSLDELREIFSEFLNKISPPSLLAEIGRKSEESSLALQTLQEFMGDLNETSLLTSDFSKRSNHYDLYNFIFLNFNYTYIFDSYIHLDKNQFNPHPYRTTDTNFSFQPDPNKYRHPTGSLTQNSCYVMSQVQHPHGQLTIPRSMLFGISEIPKTSREYKEFEKPYWAQNNIKYGSALKDVDFFIIYGMSLGSSDRWWWNQIFNSLKSGINDEHGPELLIYYYDQFSSISDNEIKEIFINNSGNKLDTSCSQLKKRIHVKLFSNSDNIFSFSTTPNHKI